MLYESIARREPEASPTVLDRRLFDGCVTDVNSDIKGNCKF